MSSKNVLDEHIRALAEAALNEELASGNACPEGMEEEFSKNFIEGFIEGYINEGKRLAANMRAIGLSEEQIEQIMNIPIDDQPNGAPK